MYNSPFEPLVDLLEGIVYYSGNEMMARLNSGSEDLILQMPDFLINRIGEAVLSRYGYLTPTQNTGVVSVFQGITINPSTDLAITLFHKDYPLRKEDWMIVRIPLEPPTIIKNEWYEKVVFKLQECNYFKQKINVQNN